MSAIIQKISTKQLIHAIKDGGNHKKFCFILGSGASIESGIPMGKTLEYDWMKELEDGFSLDEIREIAKGLELQHEFDVIEQAWEEAKRESNKSLPSEYYFDIYKLRFSTDYRDGFYYLEDIMADAKPSFGYHTLALMLTKTRSNLVITTNFDSLTEDALFLYTNKKPLVINHESLAGYADLNIQRPIIAKVHRGLFFDPLNQPQETDKLKEQWRNVLESVFQIYTPIVIGYGGGDGSLMGFLEDPNVKMKNRIYWCYYDNGKLPDERIQNLVKGKNGYLVSTAGFDAVMLALGNALFGDEILPDNTAEYFREQIETRINNYENRYNELKKPDSSDNNAEFKEEVGEIYERLAKSEKEREEQGQLTAWDYWRQGNRFYNSWQYDEAIEHYSKAIEMQSNTAAFYINRGNAYDDIGEYEEAIANFDKAIELNPKYAKAFNNRGIAYKRSGDYNKAIADYNKAIELNPKYKQAFFNRGNAYGDLGEYDKAIANFTKAIELDSKDKLAYLNRAKNYRKLGDIEKATADEEIAATL